MFIMQDIPQQDQTHSITLLKAEVAELKTANRELTERNEFLARLVLDLQETVNQLKDEINRLKGQKSRPKFPPVNLNKGNKDSGNQATKQLPSAKPGAGLKKIKNQEIIVTPPNVSAGSRFKGYSDFHVEDLNIEAVKIKYRWPFTKHHLWKFSAAVCPLN